MRSRNSTEFAKYRLEKAKETLESAIVLYNRNDLTGANNRAYYSIFYAIRAVLALEPIDFKRHKDVIAYFNKNYVKNEIFPRKMGTKIVQAQTIREDSDYDDEYEPNREKTIEQMDTAKELIALVEEYIKRKLRTAMNERFNTIRRTKRSERRTHMKITKVEALEKIAKRIRTNIIQEIYYAKSGHPGGSLSCADILTVLYFNEMHINEKEPNAEGRDRLVLSKGHASAALYATLAEKGFFEKEELISFRNISSNLQGHPDMNKIPGVDMTTGSLGQGLSVANGMALSSKIDHNGHRVYCLLGDGELQEGQIWEAAMTSSKYKLDNLCVIIDSNNLQLTGKTNDIKGLNYEDIEQKFRSFGFNTIIIDGHNIEAILEAFTKAKMCKDKPTAIIAKTIKGKGISFMENNPSWHGKSPNDEEYKKAIEELAN